nr:MAG TPA: hypothetical protein [Caudoviricetes sp.]DAK79158.1 MAG TPA: hypothetical protein [Caudoviricetes sp.]DAO49782.1 MAG TPA: hypothetical protein [Caudoviricetes sp.]
MCYRVAFYPHIYTLPYSSAYVFILPDGRIIGHTIITPQRSKINAKQ